MQKILKNIHPFSIFQTENKEKWMKRNLSEIGEMSMLASFK